MKKLPIGIQTFSELITENYYYVDKTPLIAELINNGKYYFLSRPRRFGKSLLVSTLSSVFRGEKSLFKDLYLENNWDFTKTNPVIDISFGGGVSGCLKTLNQLFNLSLKRIAYDYQISINLEQTANANFANLIQELYQVTGQRVVVLVDEYDKPILDVIDKPELALTMREELKNIYSLIKDHDKYIKFVLLTGVSKFSKVGLFSGLNNLQDITLDSRYATLCGYSEQEIKSVFTELLHDVDFDKLRQWYNGYNFLGEKVYNPFDVLLFLDKKQFKNYWFETGSPSFLLKMIRDNHYNLPDIETLFLTEHHLGSFDIKTITLETLLFQTGYLTIDHIEEFEDDTLYYLTYPNREVKASLNQHLLQDLTQSRPGEMTRDRVQIYKSLKALEFDDFKRAVNRLFASIPHDWYRKNQLADYEGYYASVIYSCFCTLGVTVIAEDSSSHGRIDLTVMIADKIFIIEFKALDDSDRQGVALEQIKQKNYQQKYLDADKSVFLIGMEFDKAQRNLAFFAWEAV